MARHDITIKTATEAVAGSTEFQKWLIKIGICSLLTAGKEEFVIADLAAIETRLGQGPLAEAVRTALEHGAEDVKVIAYPVALTTAGAAGTVTHIGTGLATHVIAGGCYDAYEVVIKIIVGGALAAATYKLSLDSGRTWFAEKAFGGVGEIKIEEHPAGNAVATLKITFSNDVTTPNSSFVAGDQYLFSCTAAEASVTDLNAKILIAAEQIENGNLHICQQLAPADWTGFATTLTSLRNAKRLMRLILEAEYLQGAETVTDWKDRLVAGVAALDNIHLSICAAYGPLTHSSGLGLKPLVNGAGLVEAIVSKAAVHQNIGWVQEFPLPVTENWPLQVSGSDTRDVSDAILDALDTAGFITYQRHSQASTAPKALRFADDNTISTGGGSVDARKIRHLRTEDKATKIMLGFATDNIKANIDPDALPSFGAAIEKLIKRQMIDNLPEADREIKGVAVTFEGTIKDLSVIINLTGIDTLGDMTVVRKLTFTAEAAETETEA